MTNSLVMIHPFDPWGSKVGGIETAIRSLIKYAPPDFSLSLIGVTENSALRSLRQWTTRDFEGVNLSFYPLFEVETPNQRTRIPLFLRFALALRSSGLNFPDAVAFYHRIEPICVSRNSGASNLLYLHSDPREWIGAHSEVRWKYIPWLYRSVEREAVRKSDWVFGVSRSTVQYLQERYPERGEQFSFSPAATGKPYFSLAGNGGRSPSPEITTAVGIAVRESSAAVCRTSGGAEESATGGGSPGKAAQAASCCASYRCRGGQPGGGNAKTCCTGWSAAATSFSRLG